MAFGAVLASSLHYKALLPTVLVSFLDAEKLTSDTDPYGWVPDRECSVWVLLGAYPKKNPGILGPVAAGSLLGFWVERYILVTPSLVSPEDVLAGVPVTPFAPLELGIGVGFLGLFFLCFFAFARVFPGAIPAKS